MDMRLKTKPLAARFWPKINKLPNNGCWEWMGARTPSGYGQLRETISRGVYRFRLTHRLSYELNIGPICDNMCVCHRCDNRKCANPDHLFLGTRLDNIIDMNQKGRRIILMGEKNGRAKLTEHQVLTIRNSPESTRSLAGFYKITKEMVYNIKKRKSWKHI